ncbi:hypothetical protein [Saccharopolyspora phatthalungensis]|uniref:Esterase-like activity of phytase family protein n=1 Tax=Saccharopolyspora phatthalungensis TaxID=664693 RepID=A0A840Q948_9PSEU|nr:hypothetical protein [Saccharopolyspora phatthalungensis]MBB5156271.1 hypothetical protein [Saccharopolyspora phatthalungensis]
MSTAGASGAVAIALLLSVASMTSARASAVAAQQPLTPVEQCRVDDDRLAELSGLASDGSAWYAIADGGSSLRVFVLDPADCSVRKIRTASNNPYDVEDLALGRDGTLWLADTGDNRRRRESVAFHVMPPGGGATLYRLRYPDGPHDAEALLLDRAGVPYIVTKEPLGAAGVYRPAEPLAAERTVPLERVGSISLRSTRTPGGPVSGALGSVLVTGGAVSQDGTVAAIRTYTEAYVYNAPDGDLVAAFRREPLRIPLPNEQQGEAIAWEPDGALLSASEGNQPVRRIPGVAAAARTTGAPTEDGESPAPPGGEADQAPPPTGQADSGLSTGRTLLFAAALAGLLVFATGRLRRRNR